MEDRVDPCLLWARALGVGSVAVLLGVAGHVTADGLLPGPLWLAALTAFSVVVSAPLLARPASPVRLIAMLVGGQAFVHLALTATAGHVGDTASPAARHPAPLDGLPVIDGRRVGSLQDAYEGMAGASSAPAPALPIGHLVDDLTAHAPMMAAHLAAAALVGLWLAYGERCLWTLLALTGRRILAAVRAIAPVGVVPHARLSRAADRAPVGPRSLWLVRPRSRRGPPLLAA